MARTFAQGSTTRITYALYAAITNLSALTVTAWTRRTGTGGSSLGRILSCGDGTNVGAGGGVEWQVYHEVVSSQSRLRFAAQRWGTSSGIWYALPGWANDSYMHIAVTYDYGSTANDPVMYKDGVSETVTETTTPSGSDAGAGSGSLYVGNVSAANRSWDGQLWDVAIWNRVLSAGEIQSVYLAGPYRSPSGLVFYAPIWGQHSPEPNYAGATTGTVTGTNAGPQFHAGWAPWGFDDTTSVGGAASGGGGGSGARSFVASMIG